MRVLRGKSLILIIICVVIAWVFVQFVAPWAIRRQLTALVTENCEDCVFNLGRTQLTLIPLGVVFEDVAFTVGNPITTNYEAHVDRIVVKISPMGLFSKQLILPHLRFEGPEVVITEGDLPSPSGEEKLPTDWTYAIQDTQILDGRFSYIRVSGKGKDGRRGVLRTTRIQGVIEELGTVPRMKAEIVRARAKGQLGNSGEFHLAIATPFFSPKLSADIDLRIADLNLDDMNAFFEEIDGVKLTGSLHQGHGSVAVREKNLNAWVKAKYLGFDLQFQKTPERSGATAFFSNLAKAVKVDKSSIGEKPRDQVRSVELQREGRETLLQFIFRGLKEAALKVATS